MDAGRCAVNEAPEPAIAVWSADRKFWGFGARAVLARDRELKELSFLCIGAVGDERMHMGMEVGGVGAEGLDREYETWCNVTAIEDRADARDDRVAGRAGKQAEQPTLALEHPAQDARNPARRLSPD